MKTFRYLWPIPAITVLSLLLSSPSALSAGQAAASQGVAGVQIQSTLPKSPAKLAAGQKLTVGISYLNPDGRAVSIWARPFTKGVRTPGYAAHPSPTYREKSGTLEGWFFFNRATEVDEVRVEMVENAAGGERQVIATASAAIKAVWSEGANAAGAGAPLTPGSAAPVERAASAADLRAKGAFGFPQTKAKVLCDTPALHFAVASNDQYLFAQAILWTDSDSALGKTEDGREIGDRSDLMLELGTKGTITPKLDRTYDLNPWPRMPGLHYQVTLSEHSWTGLQSDSKGRGAIRQVKFPDGKQVRVDTYLIPLSEISKKPGDKLALCYYAASPAPELSVDSASYLGDGKKYYGFNIPHSLYHEYILEAGPVPNISSVPEDRKKGATAITKSTVAPKAAIGDVPDFEFTGVDGREVDLSKLRGKVVLIDFWATWCGPCMAEVPSVLAVYEKLHPEGFEIIGISFDQDKAALERITKQKGMTWPQYFDGKGWQNEYGVKYGIHGIPTMWLIDQQGKIASLSARRDLAGQVEKLLAGKAK